MNIVWGFLRHRGRLRSGSDGAAVGAPSGAGGGFFGDGDRAAGVFGVLATGFSILLGFIVFLAFESYDQSRIGAEEEALVLVQQVENAQFFPPGARGALSGEFVCYGDQWSTASGTACAPGQPATPSTPGA